jgi:hypothetical protein
MRKAVHLDIKRLKQREAAEEELKEEMAREAAGAVAETDNAAS